MANVKFIPADLIAKRHFTDKLNGAFNTALIQEPIQNNENLYRRIIVGAPNDKRLSTDTVFKDSKLLYNYSKGLKLDNTDINIDWFKRLNENQQKIKNNSFGIETYNGDLYFNCSSYVEFDSDNNPIKDTFNNCWNTPIIYTRYLTDPSGTTGETQLITLRPNYTEFNAPVVHGADAKFYADCYPDNTIVESIFNNFNIEYKYDSSQSSDIYVWINNRTTVYTKTRNPKIGDIMISSRGTQYSITKVKYKPSYNLGKSDPVNQLYKYTWDNIYCKTLYVNEIIGQAKNILNAGDSSHPIYIENGVSYECTALTIGSNLSIPLNPTPKLLITKKENFSQIAKFYVNEDGESYGKVDAKNIGKLGVPIGTIIQIFKGSENPDEEHWTKLNNIDLPIKVSYVDHHGDFSPKIHESESYKGTGNAIIQEWFNLDTTSDERVEVVLAYGHYDETGLIPGTSSTIHQSTDLRKAYTEEFKKALISTKEGLTGKTYYIGCHFVEDNLTTLQKILLQKIKQKKLIFKIDASVEKAVDFGNGYFHATEQDHNDPETGWYYTAGVCINNANENTGVISHSEVCYKNDYSIEMHYDVTFEKKPAYPGHPSYYQDDHRIWSVENDADINDKNLALTFNILDFSMYNDKWKDKVKQIRYTGPKNSDFDLYIKYK